MKTPRIQAYEVTRSDGSKVDACCAPAVCAMPDVKAYRPVGAEREGVCCHKTDAGPGRVWMLGEAQMERVREHLAMKAGRSW